MTAETARASGRAGPVPGGSRPADEASQNPPGGDPEKKGKSMIMKHLENKLLENLYNRAKRGWYKIENGSWMPLSVEIIGTETLGKTNLPALSLCHYGEMNGDAMRDPEMCFGVQVHPAGVRFYPYYFRNDYAGFEEMALVDGGLRFKKCQFGQAEFAKMWAKNLEEQGFGDALQIMIDAEALAPQ
jgi:hypothetical protein